MIIGFVKDIITDLLKFLAGFAVPLLLILAGAGLVGAGFHFESVYLLGAGAMLALIGLLWVLIHVFWHTGGDL